jgi:hypothetical protein
MLPWKEPGVIAEVKEGGVKQKLGFEEDRKEKAYIPRTGTPPPPPSAREQKRPKKQASPKKTAKTAEMVASEMEGRLAQ